MMAVQEGAMTSLKFAAAIALMFAATHSWAQMTSISSAGVRGTALLEAHDSANDPAAVNVMFKEGNTLASILDGLKEKGFQIEYRQNLVPPTMTLVGLPKGTRIDDVLREILAPWDLDVYHSPYGKWVVRPSKKKLAEISQPN
jgi:hypothetical protein